MYSIHVTDTMSRHYFKYFMDINLFDLFLIITQKGRLCFTHVTDEETDTREVNTMF